MYKGLATFNLNFADMQSAANGISSVRKSIARKIRQPSSFWVLLDAGVDDDVNDFIDFANSECDSCINEIRDVYAYNFPAEVNRRRRLQFTSSNISEKKYSRLENLISTRDFRKHGSISVHYRYDIRVGSRNEYTRLSFGCASSSRPDENSNIPNLLLQIPLPVLRRLSDLDRQNFVQVLATAGGVESDGGAAGFCDISDEAESGRGDVFLSGMRPHPITWSMLVDQAVWRYRKKSWNTPRGLYWANLWSVPAGKESMIDDLERDLFSLSQVMEKYGTHVVCDRLSEERVYVSVTHDIIKGSPYINEIVTLNDIDRVIYRLASFMHDVWGCVPL